MAEQAAALRAETPDTCPQVSLVEEPDFSFSIQLQGGDITFLPGLELWLSSFIKDVLLQPYVLPEGVTIPLDPTAQRIEVSALMGAGCSWPAGVCPAWKGVESVATNHPASTMACSKGSGTPPEWLAVRLKIGVQLPAFVKVLGLGHGEIPDGCDECHQRL